MDQRTNYGVIVRISEDNYARIQKKRREMEDRDLVTYSIADALNELLMELAAS